MVLLLDELPHPAAPVPVSYCLPLHFVELLPDVFDHPYQSDDSTVCGQVQYGFEHGV